MIETPAGGTRQWYDPFQRQSGSTTMQVPYGFLQHTVGADGEGVDCFVGPDRTATHAFVISTKRGPDFTRLDEQKIMLGFPTQQAAEHAFRAHYDDDRFQAHVEPIPMWDLRNRLQTMRNGWLRGRWAS